MKKIIVILLAVCCFVSALSACNGGKASLEYNGDRGTYVDSASGIEYKVAPGYYEPFGCGEEYSSVKIGGSEIPLYTLSGIESKDWLATKGGDLFYSAKNDLPEFDELTFSTVKVYATGALASSLEINDKTDILEIVGDYLDQKGLDMSQIIANPKENETLKFISEELPGIYYVLSYLEYSDDVWVYDPVNEMTVKVSSLEDKAAEREFDEKFSSDFAAGKYESDRTAEIQMDKYVYYNDEDFVKDDNGMWYYSSNQKEFICAQNESEIPSVTQRYSPTQYHVEWSIKYNYGKYFIYNKYEKKCVPTSSLIQDRLEGTEDGNGQ